MKIALFLFLCFFLTAQNENYQYLGLEEGLSDVYVYDIFEDHAGFLWFGTQDGLNRFDGSTFHTFRYEPENSNSLSDLYVFKTIEDEYKRIWVGTSKGLNLFNQSTRTFTRFYSDPTNINTISNNVIRALYSDTIDHSVWIGTLGGLDRYLLGEEKFERIWPPIEKAYQPEMAVQAIERLDEETLFFGTNGFGLFVVFEGKDIKNVNLGRFNNIQIKALRIHKKQLWIGTLNNGILVYSIQDQNVTHIELSENALGNRVNNFLFRDSLMLISTLQGVSIVETKTLKLKGSFFSTNEGTISNRFMHMIHSKHNLLYMATQKGVLVKDYEKNNFYKILPTRKSFENGKFALRSLLEVDDLKLWIAIEYFGLQLLSLENPFAPKVLFTTNSKSLSSTEIKYLFEDSKKQIWVGTANGLNLFLTKQNKFKHYYHIPSDSNSLTSSFIWSITEDHHKKLWIGTYAGLSSFDLESEQFKQYYLDKDDPDREDIRAVFVDSKENLWAGTWNGLYKIKLDTFEKMRFSSTSDKPHRISHDIIFSINEDSGGRIWVGTSGGGLTVIDSMQLENKIYHIGNGLANNVVYSTLFDSAGFAWASTNKGLSKIDHQTAKIKNYQKEDGLQGNELTYNAYAKGKSGRFYFGGLEGGVFFNPMDIIENNSNPSLYFTDIKVLNKSITGLNPSNTDSTFVLSKASHKESELKLAYKENSFSIAFKALEFRSATNIQYAYILEGFNTDWIFAGHETVAHYTNMPAGKYAFKVRSTNTNGDWIENNLKLNVIVLKAWWQTWSFRLSVVFIIVLVVINVRSWRQRQQNRILQMKKQISADLHDSLAADLSSIALYSEALNSDKLSTSEKKSIQADLMRISNESVTSIKDIIWTIDAKKESVDEIIKRFVFYLQNVCKAKKIELLLDYHDIVEIEQPSLKIEVGQQLWFLLKEVLRNIVSHSSCDKLTFSVSDHGNELVILFEDNGIGFDKNEANTGRGLKNIRHRVTNLNGRLEIETKPKNGCQTKIYIPLI